MPVLIVTNLTASLVSFGDTDGYGKFFTVAASTHAAPLWKPSTAYVSATDYVTNGGNIYICKTSGTTAAYGGPTTTSADITDNSAHWTYVAAAAYKRVTVSSTQLTSIASQLAASQAAGTISFTVLDDTTIPDAVEALTADRPFVLFKVLSSGGSTGTADDVTILSSVPFKFRVIDWTLTTTAHIDSSTASLHSATAAGGQAYIAASPGISTGADAMVRNAAASFVVYPFGGLYLHRSDRAATGEITLVCVPEP